MIIVDRVSSGVKNNAPKNLLQNAIGVLSHFCARRKIESHFRGDSGTAVKRRFNAGCN
jgi:hypothetical protein